MSMDYKRCHCSYRTGKHTACPDQFTNNNAILLFVPPHYLALFWDQYAMPCSGEQRFRG